MDASSIARRLTGPTVTVLSARDTIGVNRVVPVLTIEEVSHAQPLAAALLAGGLSALEVTLRTPAGMDAIRSICDGTPEVVVGAGSVMTGAQATAALDAGAAFIVSPGLDDGVVAVALERDTLVIPGIGTATELMRAAAAGVDVVKLFPAESIGGVGLVRAFAAVWPTMSFMPTGGISWVVAPAYLARPEVLAVGGSWMARPAQIAVGDWNEITAAAQACVEMVEGAS